MRKLLPWLLAVPSITATVLLLLKTNGQIVLTDQQIFLAIALTAFKPLADLTLGTIGEQWESKKRKRQDLIEILLKAGLRQLINSHGLVWDKVGMNAFVVKEPWHRFGPAYLVRVGQVKFSLTHPSGVKWTKGKGVIGTCWLTEKEEGRDLHTDYSHVVDWTESIWNLESEELRQGLTFHEFNRTREYGVIVATPMFNSSGKFVGCISVDAPGGSFDQLWSIPARDRLRDVAKTVAGHLR